VHVSTWVQDGSSMPSNAGGACLMKQLPHAPRPPPNHRARLGTAAQIAHIGLPGCCYAGAAAQRCHPAGCCCCGCACRRWAGWQPAPPAAGRQGSG
jgi:hypothetical protein